MDPKVDFYCMALVGRLVINWGFAEHVLEDLIAGMIGAEISQVNALTANMATEYQIRSARAIARLRFDEFTFSQFDSVLAQFEELIPFRNKLVHGFWSPVPNTNTWTVSAVKSTGKLKTQTEFVNADYITWMENQVRRILSLLVGFGEQHGVLTWGTSPETLSVLAGPGDPPPE